MTDLRTLLATYGALSGDPGRSEAEEAQRQTLRAELQRRGKDPGWEPVAIDPNLQEPFVMDGVTYIEDPSLRPGQVVIEPVPHEYHWRSADIIINGFLVAEADVIAATKYGRYELAIDVVTTTATAQRLENIARGDGPIRISVAAGGGPHNFTGQIPRDFQWALEAPNVVRIQMGLVEMTRE